MIISQLNLKSSNPWDWLRTACIKEQNMPLENVFDICTILNTDLNLGIPLDDSGILENLAKK